VTGDVSDTDVLIIGAGPSGLALAAVLAAQRVPFRLVDAKPGPVPQSRAAIVHGRTLELLDRLGVAEQAMASGVPIQHVEIHEGGRRRGHVPLVGPDGNAYRHPLALPQQRTEQLLGRAVTAAGGRIEFGTEVVDISPTSDGFDVGLAPAGGGAQRCAARWIVGADGSRSVVRKAAGLGFTGSTYSQTGLLADVRLDAGAIDGSATIDAHALRLNLVRGGFVGVLPLGGDAYRLFGAVPPGFATRPDDDEVSHDSYATIDPVLLQEWLREYFLLDARVTDIVWSSLFRVHSRLAQRFRIGNAFLIGDAAHIHSPAGGQGMNLGIADAFNLGWKLAAVATGRARPELLDTYETERLPVARTVLRGADRGFALETAMHPAAVWLRAHLATPLIGPATRFRPVRAAVSRLLSQTWVQYRDSPAVTPTPERGGTVRAGDRAPDGPLHSASGTTVFEAVRGAEHDLLLFEGPRPLPDLMASRTAIEAIIHRYRLPIRTHLVATTNRTLHDRYDTTRPGAVLIRPDGHIGVVDDLRGRQLARHLARQFVPARRDGRPGVRSTS
jgi:2-polyprenyl-6-methoxyphenol hydroxylase-like FAD-dependent oxidoreductase